MATRTPVPAPVSTEILDPKKQDLWKSVGVGTSWWIGIIFVATALIMLLEAWLFGDVYLMKFQIVAAIAICGGCIWNNKGAMELMHCKVFLDFGTLTDKWDGSGTFVQVPYVWTAEPVDCGNQTFHLGGGDKLFRLALGRFSEMIAAKAAEIAVKKAAAAAAKAAKSSGAPTPVAAVPQGNPVVTPKELIENLKALAFFAVVKVTITGRNTGLDSLRFKMDPIGHEASILAPFIESIRETGVSTSDGTAILDDVPAFKRIFLRKLKKRCPLVNVGEENERFVLYGFSIWAKDISFREFAPADSAVINALQEPIVTKEEEEATKTAVNSLLANATSLMSVLEGTDPKWKGIASTILSFLMRYVVTKDQGEKQPKQQKNPTNK